MLFEYLSFTEILNSNDNKNCALLGYYTERSDKHYHYSLCNNLEECSSQLLRGRRLLSHSHDNKLKTIDVINNWYPYWKETGPCILLFYWIGMLPVTGNFNNIKYLTFIGPCIAYIFPEYNEQGPVFQNLFISARRCTCFKLFFRPSSGAQNGTYSVRYLSDQYCYLLLACLGIY